MSDIKWAVFQSLIGGMALSAEKAFGCLPTSVISYDGVENDDLYLDYIATTRKKNLRHFVIDGTLYSKSNTLRNDSWEAP